MKLRAGDFFIAAAVIFLAAAIWIYLFAGAGKEPRRAEIRLDGERVRSLTLEENSAVYVEGLKIAVEDGEVYVSEADCPDRVCVKTGKISRAGQSIICVPNGVSIKISGDAEFDAVAG